MYTQALLTTLRIIVFRARARRTSLRRQPPTLDPGLHRFRPRRHRGLLCAIQASPGVAILGALLNIGMLALALRATLGRARARQPLPAGLQRPADHGDLPLTLAIYLPFFIQILPATARSPPSWPRTPNLAQQPDQVSAMISPIISPVAGPFFIIFVLLIWQLVVIGYVFYKTAGSVALFVLLGLLLLLTVLTFGDRLKRPAPALTP